MRGSSRALLPLLLALPACGSARILAFDAVAPAGTAAILRVKVEREETAHRDIEGVPLVFAQGHEVVGRATTGDDGIATLPWASPSATPAMHEVLVTIAPEAGYDAPAAKVRVFVRDPKRPVLVVDLDGTVSSASALAVATKDPEDLPALEGAADALRALAKRYDLLYVTARDDGLCDRSREWLDFHGFPRAPILFRDLKPTTLSAERYKRERLLELKRHFRLVAGVGDRDEDGKAYLAAGMKALLVGPGSTPEGARRYADWARIREQLERE